MYISRPFTAKPITMNKYVILTELPGTFITIYFVKVEQISISNNQCCCRWRFTFEN